MLPAGHRLRLRRDHVATVRGGRRAGRRTLVVHLLAADRPVTSPARVGFAVSRAVGGSVTRHRVVRRLRALAAARIGRLRPGDRMVVRALPPAATADSAALGADLDAALDRLLDGACRPQPVGAAPGGAAGRTQR